jgi:hypothetical protein
MSKINKKVRFSEWFLSFSLKERKMAKIFVRIALLAKNKTKIVKKR